MGGGKSADVESVNPLLTPFQLGPFKLSHRIALAPLTRCRSTGNVPQPHAVTYYSQRATPGGLLIAEGTSPADTGHGYPRTPGIYTDEQVEAWKPIVQAVHAKGGVFFCQLWHVGRLSHCDYQPNNAAPISATSKLLEGKLVLKSHEEVDYSPPRQITTDEVSELIVEPFRLAARNAMKAGFDGVEIHAAHGYIFEQFLKDSVNDRTDKYGTQNFENRSRAVLETVDALVEEVGADRVGIRFSPYASHGNAPTSDPITFYTYLLGRLSGRKIAYVHVVEHRVNGITDRESQPDCTLTPFRRAFKGAFLAAGGYDRVDGMKAVESGRADLVVYGRKFLANPDLPRRLELDAPLNQYNRQTFYIPHPVIGYTDYPFLTEHQIQALKH